MMNLKMNAQNNQGQAMDYFYGMRSDNFLIDLLDYVRKHDIKYRKLGDNYIFYWNYLVEDLAEGVTQSLGDYKYLIVVTEKIYSVKNAGMVGYYSVFGTNDDKKAEKFSAFVQAEKLNDENELSLDITDLEGKIFPNRQERREMAEDGMYLG